MHIPGKFYRFMHYSCMTLHNFMSSFLSLQGLVEGVNVQWSQIPSSEVYPKFLQSSVAFQKSYYSAVTKINPPESHRFWYLTFQHTHKLVNYWFMRLQWYTYYLESSISLMFSIITINSLTTLSTDWLFMKYLFLIFLKVVFVYTMSSWISLI